MKNITVAVSDEAWHGARVWAARRDVSLSKIVQDFLEDLPRLPGARAFPLSRFEEENGPDCDERVAARVQKRSNGEQLAS